MDEHTWNECLNRHTELLGVCLEMKGLIRDFPKRMFQIEHKTWIDGDYVILLEQELTNLRNKKYE